MEDPTFAYRLVFQYLETMEVHFTPEQEAQLAQIASKAGTDAERLVKDAALRLLQEDASLRRGPLKGLPRPIAASSLKLKRRFRRPPGADAGLLKMRIRWTPAAAGDLQHINDYPLENTIRITASPLFEAGFYETVCALKESLLPKRPGLLRPSRGRLAKVCDAWKSILEARIVLSKALPYIAHYRVTPT